MKRPASYSSTAFLNFSIYESVCDGTSAIDTDMTAQKRMHIFNKVDFTLIPF